MADQVIGSVSDTAFAVAHSRAVESERPDALFRDPLAARLAGAEGKRFAQAMPMPAVVQWIVVIRTRIIDDYIREAIAAGVDVVLNLGAGLDTRPYRMELPENLLWIEADYPRVIDFKAAKLADEKTRCRLERVKADLANGEQRREVLASVHARSKKMLVLTEGVIPYLASEEVGALADDLAGLERIWGWVVEYFSPQMVKFRMRRRVQQKMQNAPFRFIPGDWLGFFAAHGWRPREIRYAGEEADRLQRQPELPFFFGLLFALRRLVASKKRQAALKKLSGYAILERAPATIDRSWLDKKS